MRVAITGGCGTSALGDRRGAGDAYAGPRAHGAGQADFRLRGEPELTSRREARAATVALARGMAGMAGTMGLGLAVFVSVRTPMMAAMMLPSVTPTASPYAKTVQGNRTVRIAGLAGGYLGAWAAAGPPAYGLAGVAALALAAAVVWFPWLAPGLRAPPPMMT